MSSTDGALNLIDLVKRVPVHRMRAFERGGKVPREYKRKIIVALQTEPPPEKPKQKRAWKKTGG